MAGDGEEEDNLMRHTGIQNGSINYIIGNKKTTQKVWKWTLPGSPPTNVIDPGINPPPKTALSSGSSGIRVRRSFNDPLL